MNILASTNVDLHGDKLTLAVLEQMKETINGERSIRMSLEHNPLFPPLGQFINAKIVESPDEKGIYILLAESILYEDYEDIPNSNNLVRNYSKKHSRPFIEDSLALEENIQIDIDFRDFQSKQEISLFKEDIASNVDNRIVIHEKVRKSYIPDPEIIITLSKYFLIYKLAKPVAEKVTNKVVENIAEDIFESYLKLKKVILKSVKYLLKKNRPILYLIEIPNEIITIELACKVTKDNLQMFVDATSIEKINELIERSQKIQSRFNGKKCQFVLNDYQEWEFTYLLTKDGHIIGDREIFKIRNSTYKRMLDGESYGFSSGARISRSNDESQQ